MTDCDTTVELLPWLLNGALEPAERASVLVHLRGCAACRRELADTAAALELFAGHVPSPELVAHAFGEAVADPVALESHLTGCAQCRDDLELVRGARTLEVLVAPPRRAPSAAWRTAALAAAAVAVLALAGLLVLPGQAARQARDEAAVRLDRLEGEVDELSRLAADLRQRLQATAGPLANVAVLEILPASFALRGDTEVVTLERNAAGVLLVLVTDAQGTFDELRVSARDAGGTNLWQLADLALQPTGEVTLLLPPGELSGGRLELELEGRRGDGWQTLDAYVLEIR